MDIEKLNTFKNYVANLSDASPVAEWDNVVTQLGILYKDEVAEVLTGATTPTLATERSDTDTDITSLVTEFDQPTQN